MQSDAQRTPSPWQAVMGLNQYVQQLQCQINDQQALINRLSQQLDMLNERIMAVENKPYYHVDTIQYHFDQLKVEKLSGTLNIGMSAPSEDQIKEIGQLVMPAGGGDGGIGGNAGNAGNAANAGKAGNASSAVNHVNAGSAGNAGNHMNGIKTAYPAHAASAGSAANGGNGWNGLVSNGAAIGNGGIVVNEPKSPSEPKTDPQATNTPHQFPAPASLGIPPAVTPAPPYPEIRRVIDCYLDQSAPLNLQRFEAEAGISLDPYHRRLVIEDIRKQMSQRIQFYIQTLSRESEGEHDQGPAAAGSEPGLPDEVIRKTERDIDMALKNYVRRLTSSP